jgi:hypothetical protein
LKFEPEDPMRGNQPFSLVLALSASLAWAGLARGEILYGTIATGNAPYDSSLVTFNTTNPSTFLSNVQFNGADLGTPATGNPNGQQFFMSGIDFQPSTFLLFGMSFRSGFEQHTYTVNPNNGTATEFSNAQFLGASSASFNFDPVRNVIREAADQRGNTHLNPANGAVTNDTNLAYASGDPNFGILPVVASAAYTNHAGTQSSTTLYGIDARGTGTLVQIGTPGNATSSDTGQLHTVGPLNLSFTIPISSQVGFFISPLTGNAYAAIEQTQFDVSFLFSINLNTGAATALGQIGPNGGPPVWGLTAVPEPGSLLLVGVAASAMAARLVRRRKAAR